jgi:hypothetical protein
MPKTDYHVLARHVPSGQIDVEVSDVLDAILHASNQAKPLGG